MFPNEDTSQRLILYFDDHSLSYPLPELGLRGPKAFSITANYLCRFAFLLFCILFDCHDLELYLD
jgi:hypothetical protein